MHWVTEFTHEAIEERSDLNYFRVLIELYAGNSPKTVRYLLQNTTVKIRQTWGQSAGKTPMENPQRLHALT